MRLIEGLVCMERLVTYCLRQGTAPEGRGPLGRSSGIDGKIILEWSNGM